MSVKTTAKDRINPEMGKRLKEKRDLKGMTQKEMAGHLGITIQAYQNYEYGKEVSSGRLIQICAILECSPNWILGYHEKGMQLAPDSLLLKQLKDAFEKLNEDGQQKVTEYAQDLTTMPKYTDSGGKTTSASAGA